MARRIELQGIANALNESFISRNNDFAGYWAIGQLKSFSINNTLSSIIFSLTAPATNTIFNLQNYIVLHYSKKLAYLLKKQQIPDCWVHKISITIDFSVNAKHEQLRDYPTSGEPFQCCCKITDDTGRVYTSIRYGRCQPHSRVNELKSFRKLIG